MFSHSKSRMLTLVAVYGAAASVAFCDFSNSDSQRLLSIAQSSEKIEHQLELMPDNGDTTTASILYNILMGEWSESASRIPYFHVDSLMGRLYSIKMQQTNSYIAATHRFNKGRATYGTDAAESDVSILGALMGWPTASWINGRVYTNGVLGKLEYLPKILQEAYNTSEALYNENYTTNLYERVAFNGVTLDKIESALKSVDKTKSIYDMVDERLLGLSNSVASSVSDLSNVIQNLETTVVGPVDLTMLTNIAVMIYNSFSSVGSGQNIQDFFALSSAGDFDTIRYFYGLGVLYPAFLLDVYPYNNFSGFEFGERILNMLPYDARINSQSLDGMLYEMFSPYEDQTALELYSRAEVMRYYMYNTLETYTYLTNMLPYLVYLQELTNMNSLASSFQNVSLVKRQNNYNGTYTYNIDSNEVQHVGGAAENMAGIFAKGYIPSSIRTNAIGEVEAPGWAGWLRGLLRTQEDATISTAFHSMSDTFNYSLESWSGGDSYVLHLAMPWSGYGNHVGNDNEQRTIDIDFELSETAKEKIDGFWSIMVRIAKYIMVYVFATSTYSAIHGMVHSTNLDDI